MSGKLAITYLVVNQFSLYFSSSNEVFLYLSYWEGGRKQFKRFQPFQWFQAFQPVQIVHGTATKSRLFRLITHWSVRSVNLGYPEAQYLQALKNRTGTRYLCA